MRDFYANVVPRIRSKVFGTLGRDIELELITSKSARDQYVMIAIYHAIKEKTPDGIRQAIQNLLVDRILASHTENPMQFWTDLFEQVLLTEGCDYFNTTSGDLRSLKESWFLKRQNGK